MTFGNTKVYDLERLLRCLRCSQAGNYTCIKELCKN